MIDSLETDDVTHIKCQKLIIKVAVGTPTHVIEKLCFFHLMKYKLYLFLSHAQRLQLLSFLVLHWFACMHLAPVVK